MPRKKIPQKPKSGESDPVSLEIVLKCDVSGTEEAVRSSLALIEVPRVDLAIIQSGVGSITKSDILMAQTGSRLVIGFNVDTMPKLEQHIKEHGVEVRLYDTIYKLNEDVKKIAGNMFAKEPREKITGRANVIATFGGGRKAMVIGCEVQEGTIEAGKRFRVITAMGPAYSGKITSLQVEKQNVKIGKTGQQVGIQVADWKNAKVGDLIECYETIRSSGSSPWKPRSGIFRYPA